MKSVQQAFSSSGGGPLYTGASQYLVVLSLPAKSFPATGDTLKLLAAQPPTQQYLKLVAVPSNSANGFFTAVSVVPATQLEFQDQVIEYKGNALQPAQCPNSNCSGVPLVFNLGSSALQFFLNSQTLVQGFGTPPTIAAGQTVDVFVQFVQSQPYNVGQVTSPTTTVINKFQISPFPYFTQYCTKTNPLPPLTIRLDNTGSNVNATWQVSITDTDLRNNLWATASPTSGVVQAGSQENLTITPAFLCNNVIYTGKSFTATISYAVFGQAGSIIVTDLIYGLYNPPT